MNLLLVMFFFLLNALQANWYIYFEDKQIEISYSISVCEDKKYEIKDELFLIKVKNKTNETLVINFYLGEREDEENKVAFVLNPGEVKTGDCDNRFDLSIYSRDINISKKEPPSEFNLSNINVIEVY